MSRVKTKIASLAILGFVGLLLLTGCPAPADVASKNLSKKADMFQVDRRIVFYNGITGSYMLEMIGKCSLGNFDAAGQLTVTCKTGPGVFKKHFLGLSDNVTYFAEQLEDVDASIYRYKVIFNPSVIIPDIDLIK
ncbi:MAG: beta-sandwich lipoprotein [Candidatus Thorarchaeota archaeon]|jgi:hypothetical protein